MARLAGSLLDAVLLDLVQAYAAPDRGESFEHALDPRSMNIATVRAALATATREVGRFALKLSDEDEARLRSVGVTWALSAWAIDDLARATALVLASARLPSDDVLAVVDERYAAGDDRERQAILRALPLLHEGARFLPVALEAARTAPPPLFEAIACENPYPSLHFPAPAFNRLVVRALSSAISLSRIVGLGRRVTEELVRMANDFARDRAAEGRRVPSDLSVLIAATRTAA